MLSIYRVYSRAFVAKKKLCWKELSIKTASLLSRESPVGAPSRSFASFDRNSIQGDFGAYAKEYDESIQYPETFWKKAAGSLHWFEEPQITLKRNENNPSLDEWFPDGKLNTSFNCLDVHVNNGRGDQIALIYDSPVTGKKEQYTYKDLLDKVSTFSGGLRNDLGVQSGDRVVIYMPVVPQAAIAMLACARIGTSYCLCW